MPDNKIHLMVGTPAYGGLVTAHYALSVFKLQQACAKGANMEISVWVPWGDALITRARQDLVAHFLGDPTATHLLFVDGDIAFEAAQVFRLLGFGADVCAGVYPVKRLDWDRIEAVAGEKRKPLGASSMTYVFEFEDPKRIASRNGFARVKHAGTGFMLIRRAALEKMVAQYPDLKYQNTNKADDPLGQSPWRYAFFNPILDKATETYLSEDFSFCKRWTDMGGEVWADLQSRLVHIGAVPFVGDSATQFGPA